MYAIVEWTDENPPQVSVVPKSWLSEDQTKCHWPPNEVAKKMKRKDFEKLTMPTPDKEWIAHNVKCMRTEGKLKHVLKLLTVMIV